MIKPTKAELSALARIFPADFQWGVGTAAYQVEGSLAADGRGPSIWDDFVLQPGRVIDGSTGRVASDHYRHWQDDIGLLKAIGVNSYRFSFAWPRIAPDGRTINAAGLAFYDRLVDGLMNADIRPVGTLFHWDLPAALQVNGGWLDRDTSYRFADYAVHVADALGDRIKDWFTVIEPYIMTRHSHVLGEHAPGKTLGTGEAFQAIHHLLLGHGLAVVGMREVTDGKIGLTNHPSPSRPYSDYPADIEANAVFDAVRNNAVPDAVLLGKYPDEVLNLEGFDSSMVRAGDMETISAPVDMFGLTYYHTSVIKAPSSAAAEPFEAVPIEGVRYTTMPWPIVPGGFRDLLVGMKARYGDKLPPLVITENGCSMPDEVEPNGAIADHDRIEFLHAYLSSLAAAITDGVEVAGYFVWSFMDHFEWDLGYTKRWGLVHVDFDTLARTPKASAGWYADLIRTWQLSSAPKSSGAD